MALKVYGGLTFVGGKQVRTIVATTSQKLAAELTGVSLSYLRAYWSVTGNAHEIEVAMAMPGTVFRTEYKGDRFSPVQTTE